MRLCVGCGPNPCGDVNTDVGPMQINTYPLGPTKADFYCDAHFLPFIDRSFDEVYASHVIEHLRSPITALKEWERVGKKVIVKTPHRFIRGNSRNPSHLWGLNRNWFARQGYHVEVKYLNLTSHFITLSMISEITATKVMD